MILSNSDNYLAAEPLRIPEAVWTEGLRRTYLRIERMGIEVILMRGVP